MNEAFLLLVCNLYIKIMHDVKRNMMKTLYGEKIKNAYSKNINKDKTLSEAPPDWDSELSKTNGYVQFSP